MSRNCLSCLAWAAVMAALTCFATTAVLAAEVTGQSRLVALDRVVAVVNSEVITQLDLNEQMKAAMLQLRRQGTPAPERALLVPLTNALAVPFDFALAPGAPLGPDSALVLYAEPRTLVPGAARSFAVEFGASPASGTARKGRALTSFASGGVSGFSR